MVEVPCIDRSRMGRLPCHTRADEAIAVNSNSTVPAGRNSVPGAVESAAWRRLGQFSESVHCSGGVRVFNSITSTSLR